MGDCYTRINFFFTRAVKPLRDPSMAGAPLLQLLEHLVHPNSSAFIDELTKAKISSPQLVVSKPCKIKSSSKLFLPR